MNYETIAEEVNHRAQLRGGDVLKRAFDRQPKLEKEHRKKEKMVRLAMSYSVGVEKLKEMIQDKQAGLDLVVDTRLLETKCLIEELIKHRREAAKSACLIMEPSPEYLKAVWGRVPLEYGSPIVDILSPNPKNFCNSEAQTRVPKEDYYPPKPPIGFRWLFDR